MLSPSRLPSPHLPSATASPSSSPHLVADSLTFTSTPALAPARSSSPHSTARADVGCSARVWARLVRSATPLCRVPIGRGCSAREGVIWSAGLLAPRCWQRYSVVDLRAEGLGRRLRRRVPVNPGRSAGNSARETAAGRAVRAAPPSIARRASLPRRGLGAASSAVPTPRVVPGPAQAIHE